MNTEKTCLFFHTKKTIKRARSKKKAVHDHYSESDPDELDDDPDASESLDELELNLPPDLLLSPAAPEAGPLAASAPPAF